MSFRYRVSATGRGAGALALALVLVAGSLPAAAAGRAPAVKRGAMTDRKTETATVAGGCFWCIEAVFEQLKGVERVTSGYCGGSVPDPTYEQVCGGATGHAEAVQVTFDPAILGYRDLLRIFFAFHDPTTTDRQGPDEGTQYRSVIFFHDAAQEAAAEAVIAELTKARVFDAPIVTEVAPLTRFYPAEGYHQGYYQRDSGQPYCRATISPKLAKLRKLYAARLKTAK